MKRILLFSAIATVVLTSCSTAYQAGQTPDDLYFSPGPARDEVASKQQKHSQADEDQYQEYISSSDDRYLHMKVANRERWETIDNYAYWNDSRYDFNNYSYSGFYNSFGFYNPYYASINPYYVGAGWMLGLNYFGAYPGLYGPAYGYGYGYGYNYYNVGWGNPLYTVIGYSAPKALGGTSTPISNINAYKNRVYNNVNSAYSSYRTPSGNQYSFSNLVKRVVTGSGNNTTTFERPTRSFTQQPGSTTTTPVYNGGSSSAGGNSGGFHSTGSSASTGRGGKG